MSKFLCVHIFRKRLTYALALTVIGSVVYVFYQIVVFTQITENETAGESRAGSPTVRGVDPELWRFYEKNEDGIFQCIRSGELVAFDKVNDDYCDCSDGSDEPGTDACGNGEFYCTYRKKFDRYPRKIPSNKVNDGVCDCCDGSDEWKRKGLLTMENVKVFSKFKLNFCPEVCPKGSWGVF